MPRLFTRLACSLLLSSCTGPAALAAGPVAPAAETADCAVPLPAALADARLPDPFLRADGTRVRSVEDWACHRQALRATAEAHVYGPRGQAPERVEGRIEDGRLQAIVHAGGRSVAFDARLRLPPGPGPHPVVIVVGGAAGIDDALLAEAGVARLDFVPTQVGAETGQGRVKRGAFFDLYGDPVQATGTLMAWAWGVSRLIDAIEAGAVGVLRADAVAVAGCSRYGKGALAAGAFDERVSLTLPTESGSGGVPLWRGVVGEGAQPPHSAFGEQPWLGDGFGIHAHSPHALPLDQHAVLALIAPRGLLVLDNPHVDWLGARHGHASVLAAAEVYRALGAPGAIGYHSAVGNGTHCAWRPEWDAPVRAAVAQHLLRRTGTALPLLAAPGRAADAHALRDWSAPVLSTAPAPSPGER